MNEAEVSIKAKDALLNYSEVIPNYLWQIQSYFPNRRPNRKQIFSKFRITHNITIEDIISTLKEVMKEFKFYSKK